MFPFNFTSNNKIKYTLGFSSDCNLRVQSSCGIRFFMAQKLINNNAFLGGKFIFQILDDDFIFKMMHI